jgi:peroxiredoxin (alkyl hydroperoxide reductase subunit C)
MKKTILMIALILLAAITYSQQNTRVPVLGEKAPSFTVPTTNGTITFPKDFGRSWKILFSHPADFTPVCSSEILELAFMEEEFNKLNARFLVLSVDSVDRHNDWKKSMEEIDYQGRGRVKINVPMAADRQYRVSRQYGMIHDASSDKKTVRGVFIIDPDNVIQSIVYYPMTVGRSMEEIKRLLIALQTVAGKEISTPANWEPGNDVFIHFKPTPEEMKDADHGIYELSWFMVYQKLKK